MFEVSTTTQKLGELDSQLLHARNFARKAPVKVANIEKADVEELYKPFMPKTSEYRSEQCWAANDALVNVLVVNQPSITFQQAADPKELQLLTQNLCEYKGFLFMDGKAMVELEGPVVFSQVLGDVAAVATSTLLYLFTKSQLRLILPTVLLNNPISYAIVPTKDPLNVDMLTCLAGGVLCHARFRPGRSFEAEKGLQLAHLRPICDIPVCIATRVRVHNFDQSESFGSIFVPDGAMHSPRTLIQLDYIGMNQQPQTAVISFQVLDKAETKYKLELLAGTEAISGHRCYTHETSVQCMDAGIVLTGDRDQIRVDDEWCRCAVQQRYSVLHKGIARRALTYVLPGKQITIKVNTAPESWISVYSETDLGRAVQLIRGKTMWESDGLLLKDTGNAVEDVKYCVTLVKLDSQFDGPVVRQANAPSCQPAPRFLNQMQCSPVYFVDSFDERMELAESFHEDLKQTILRPDAPVFVVTTGNQLAIVQGKQRITVSDVQIQKNPKVMLLKQPCKQEEAADYSFVFAFGEIGQTYVLSYATQCSDATRNLNELLFQSQQLHLVQCNESQKTIENLALHYQDPFHQIAATVLQGEKEKLGNQFKLFLQNGLLVSNYVEKELDFNEQDYFVIENRLLCCLVQLFFDAKSHIYLDINAMKFIFKEYEAEYGSQLYLLFVQGLRQLQSYAEYVERQDVILGLIRYLFQEKMGPICSTLTKEATQQLLIVFNEMVLQMQLLRMVTDSEFQGDADKLHETLLKQRRAFITPSAYAVSLESQSKSATSELGLYLAFHSMAIIPNTEIRHFPVPQFVSMYSAAEQRSAGQILTVFLPTLENYASYAASADASKEFFSTGTLIRFCKAYSYIFNGEPQQAAPICQEELELRGQQAKPSEAIAGARTKALFGTLFERWAEYVRATDNRQLIELFSAALGNIKLTSVRHLDVMADFLLAAERSGANSFSRFMSGSPVDRLLQIAPDLSLQKLGAVSPKTLQEVFSAASEGNKFLQLLFEASEAQKDVNWNTVVNTVLFGLQQCVQAPVRQELCKYVFFHLPVHACASDETLYNMLAQYLVGQLSGAETVFALLTQFVQFSIPVSPHLLTQMGSAADETLGKLADIFVNASYLSVDNYAAFVGSFEGNDTFMDTLNSKVIAAAIRKGRTDFVRVFKAQNAESFDFALLNELCAGSVSRNAIRELSSFLGFDSDYVIAKVLKGYLTLTELVQSSFDEKAPDDVDGRNKAQGDVEQQLSQQHTLNLFVRLAWAIAPRAGPIDQLASDDLQVQISLASGREQFERIITEIAELYYVSVQGFFKGSAQGSHIGPYFAGLSKALEQIFPQNTALTLTLQALTRQVEAGKIPGETVAAALQDEKQTDFTKIFSTPTTTLLQDKRAPDLIASLMAVSKARSKPARFYALLFNVTQGSQSLQSELAQSPGTIQAKPYLPRLSKADAMAIMRDFCISDVPKVFLKTTRERYDVQASASHALEWRDVLEGLRLQFFVERLLLTQDNLAEAQQLVAAFLLAGESNVPALFDADEAASMIEKEVMKAFDFENSKAAARINKAILRAICQMDDTRFSGILSNVKSVNLALLCEFKPGSSFDGLRAALMAEKRQIDALMESGNPQLVEMMSSSLLEKSVSNDTAQLVKSAAAYFNALGQKQSISLFDFARTKQLDVEQFVQGQLEALGQATELNVLDYIEHLTAVLQLLQEKDVQHVVQKITVAILANTRIVDTNVDSSAIPEFATKPAGLSVWDEDKSESDEAPKKTVTSQIQKSGWDDDSESQEDESPKERQTQKQSQPAKAAGWESEESSSSPQPQQAKKQAALQLDASHVHFLQEHPQKISPASQEAILSLLHLHEVSVERELMLSSSLSIGAKISLLCGQALSKEAYELMITTQLLSLRYSEPRPSALQNISEIVPLFSSSNGLQLFAGCFKPSVSEEASAAPLTFDSAHIFTMLLDAFGALESPEDFVPELYGFAEQGLIDFSFNKLNPKMHIFTELLKPGKDIAELLVGTGNKVCGYGALLCAKGVLNLSTQLKLWLAAETIRGEISGVRLDPKVLLSQAPAEQNIQELLLYHRACSLYQIAPQLQPKTHQGQLLSAACAAIFSEGKRQELQAMLETCLEKFDFDADGWLLIAPGEWLEERARIPAAALAGIQLLQLGPFAGKLGDPNVPPTIITTMREDLSIETYVERIGADYQQLSDLSKMRTSASAASKASRFLSGAAKLIFK